MPVPQLLPVDLFETALRTRDEIPAGIVDEVQFMIVSIAEGVQPAKGGQTAGVCSFSPLAIHILL